jgi:hypothetical protein
MRPRILLGMTLLFIAIGSLAARCDDDEPKDPDAVPTYATKVEDAPIDDLQLVIRESFPPQYAVEITSGLPSGCAQFDEAKVTGRAGNEITIRVTNTVPADGDIACTAIYGTKVTIVDIGSDFQSGQPYTVRVNDKKLEFTAQ